MVNVPNEIDLDLLLTGVSNKRSTKRQSLKRKKRKSKRRSRKRKSKRRSRKRKSKRRSIKRKKRRSLKKKQFKFGMIPETEEDQITTDINILLARAQEFDRLSAELRRKEQKEELERTFKNVKEKTSKYITNVGKQLGYWTLITTYFTGAFVWNNTKKLVKLIKAINKKSVNKEKKNQSVALSTWVYQGYTPKTWEDNARKLSKIECILYRNLCEQEIQTLGLPGVTPVIEGRNDTITSLQAKV